MKHSITRKKDTNNFDFIWLAIFFYLFYLKKSKYILQGENIHVEPFHLF